MVNYFKDDVMTGRVAVVTGGGSGIGFELARQLGLHKAKGVVIMGRRQQFLDQAVKALQAEGIQAAAYAGDVRKGQDCDAVCELARSKFGSLDILINCAAGNFLAAAEMLTPNGFRTVQEIDLLGTFNMCRSAFPGLKESKFGGNVINITATLHYGATWWQAAACSAKAGIDALGRTLGLEWGHYNIRVNGVAPGPIADTPGLKKLSAGSDKAMDWSKSVALERPGTKEEIASTVIFLCLNQYITSEVIVVDGGNWMMKPQGVPREAVLAASKAIEKTSRDMGPGSSKL